MSKQQPLKLRVGDIVRVLDKEAFNEIAVCIESDGYWPHKYQLLGNVNECIALLKKSKRNS